MVKSYSKLVGIGKSRCTIVRRDSNHAGIQKIPIRNIQRMSGHQDLNTLRLDDLDRENLEDNVINELSYGID